MPFCWFCHLAAQILKTMSGKSISVKITAFLFLPLLFGVLLIYVHGTLCTVKFRHFKTGPYCVPLHYIYFFFFFFFFFLYFKFYKISILENPYSTVTFETCETGDRPIAFTARSRRLWVQFQSDQQNTAKGFSIPFVTYNGEVLFFLMSYASLQQKNGKKE